MSKVLTLIGLEQNLYVYLSNAYDARHATSAMAYLTELAHRLDIDDYLDMLENLVGYDVELDDDLLDLIDASPVALYES